MVEQIIDIEYEEVSENKRLFSRKFRSQGVIFRTVRELWSLEPNFSSKYWTFGYYFMFWAVLIWFAIAIDLIVLTGIGIFKGGLALAKFLIQLTGKTAEKAITKLLLPVLRNTMMLGIIIIIAIILIYRFDFIRENVLKLFDMLKK